MAFALTASSSVTSNVDGATTGNKLFTVSPFIQQTLDPCVVLMKQMIQEYQPLWLDDKIGIVSLAQGVVYWEPPETCQKAIQESVSAKPDVFQLHTYGPDEGLPDLRESFRQKVMQENQLFNHQVMITMGANQAYMNCVLALGGKERSCVVFTPYYFNHVMALQMTNTPIVFCDCNDEGIPNVAKLEELLQSDSTIHMVTLTNPGNPTGVLLPRALVQSIVTLCQQYHVWLILDVTYEYFQNNYLQQQQDEVVLENVCFSDPHVIHIFSFSKSYSMAGYRCGCLVVPDVDGETSDLWPQLLKVQDTIPIGPSRISQIAALGALKSGRSWVLQRVKTLTESRQAILNALKPLPHIMGGSGAMYVMAQLPNEVTEGPDDTTMTSRKPQNDVALARKLVQIYGVAVIPGSFCGKPGWIRVCYANLSAEKCLAAANRLGRGLRELLCLSDKNATLIN